MVLDLVSQDKFRKMMIRHLSEVIELLFDENIEFSILTSLSNITFDPPLPEHISADFKPITLFTLAGYTYDSAKLEDNVLSFEAGFGRENFGSFVTVPLYAILQIIIENTPIVINLATPPEEKEEIKKPKEESSIKKSMDIFLSNPKNKKLLKKRKNTVNP